MRLHLPEKSVHIFGIFHKLFLALYFTSQGANHFVCRWLSVLIHEKSTRVRLISSIVCKIKVYGI